MESSLLSTPKYSSEESVDVCAVVRVDYQSLTMESLKMTPHGEKPRDTVLLMSIKKVQDRTNPVRTTAGHS